MFSLHYKTRKKGKFDEGERSCVIIGSPLGHKSYKVFDISTNSVYASKKVVFFENKFPYEKKSDQKKNNKV